MLPPPTERIRFREMVSDDFELMRSLLGNRDVMRFYPHPKSDDEVRRWIDWTLRSYAEHGYALWVLELKDTGAFIGDCGLTWQQVDGEPALEVGYRLLPEYQGKGLATEAAAACLNLAFDRLDAQHVVAIINPENAPSRRLAVRLGMILERETETATGQVVVVYGVRRSLP